MNATTGSGSVIVSTTEVARGSTVTGTVDVEMGSDDWRELEFSTVSGDIIVRLPDGLDTDIKFSSLSGDFRSDFDIDIERQRNRLIGSSLSGTIGSAARSDQVAVSCRSRP